jgi:hypothetical protein
LGTALPAEAQRAQTLHIRDGRVYVNGRLVDRDDVPASLETRGIEVRYSFTGDVTPVFSIGDGLYRLVNGQLEEVEPVQQEADGVSVYFRDANPLQPQSATSRMADQMARGRQASATEETANLHQQLGLLQAQVQEVQRLSQQAEAEEASQRLGQLIQEFNRMIQTSSILPPEQRYMSDVQAQNAELYDRLVREWQMENETLHLAESIRRLPRSDQREAQVDLLRDLLNDIFDLKQQNRQREIDALEAEMNELRERLDTRERLRDEIIDQRLQELVGRSARRE